MDLIAKALEGHYREEHIFALQQAHEAYEFFHGQIDKCEKKIQQALHTIQAKEEACSEGEGQHQPELIKKNNPKKAYNRSPYHFNAMVEIKKITKADLTTIPGIDENTAMKILSEIGTDMSRWRNAKAFVSWLGLCPGNKVSGGKF